MSVEIYKEPEYEIYIPSKTKDKILISQEKIDLVIKFITGKAMDEYGGCNVIRNVRGYWKGEDGEKVTEDNTVIRVVGGNPLTEEDIEKINDYLGQECIAIKKTPNCEMQLHYGKQKENIRYYKETSDDGEIEYVYVCYGEYGEITGGGRMTEDQRFLYTKEGQEAFQEMMDLLDREE